MGKTFLFYDLETSGLDKAFDQVMQFAAIRTDASLNELERYEYPVAITKDIIPSARAMITHGQPLLTEGPYESEVILKYDICYVNPILGMVVLTPCRLMMSFCVTHFTDNS